ncbi:hypothetical protein ACET3Z_002082 [Daucus carota]
MENNQSSEKYFSFRSVPVDFILTNVVCYTFDCYRQGNKTFMEMSTDQKITYQLQKQDEPQMRKKGGLITMPFIIANEEIDRNFS